MTDLPLADLKSIRRATGTTLNDVYLAVCAGPCGAIWWTGGELPRRPLVASVPVSTDPNVARMSGNRVDNLYVSIGTDIADPVERLAAHPRRMQWQLPRKFAACPGPRSLRAARQFCAATDLPFGVDGSGAGPTLRTGSTHLSTSCCPMSSGPRERIYFGPIEIEALYSVGPILEGIGLNITAWSYEQTLGVSLLGCSGRASPILG
jgi:diacylglycerol O-acyltransferase